MHMSEFEICRDYESAKDKNEQIKILADMNVCEPSEIIDVLVKNGKISGIKKERTEAKKKKSIKGSPRFSPEEWAQIKKLHDEGVPAKEIAEKLGYDSQAVSNKIWYEKKKRAKVGFEKPAECNSTDVPKSNIDDTYIKELEGIINEQQVKIGEMKAEKENLKLELKNAKADIDERRTANEGLLDELKAKASTVEDLQNKCDALEALANDGAGELSDVLNEIELLAKLAYGCTNSVVRMDEEIKSALLRICFIISDVKTEGNNGQ